MPCWIRVQIEVEDEESAREALKAMGYDAADIKYMLNVRSGKLMVDIYDSKQRREFKVQYAKSFSIKQAKKSYFKFAKETKNKDGSIVLVFRK